MSKPRKEHAMLNILADALMLATGHRPDRRHQSRPVDSDWADRFISSRLGGLDTQSRRVNPARDLNW
jgi:hypothetical protein